MAAILVTGATGRIGRALVAALERRGDSVLSLMRPGGIANPNPEKNRFEHDLAASPLPAEAFGTVQQVVHLAGLVGSHPYSMLYSANALATKNLLANCPSHLQKIVLASSISVYGVYPGKVVDESFAAVPDTPYGRSKLLAETFAREYCSSLPLVFLRFGMIYGPGFEEGYYPVLSYLQKGKLNMIGDGKNRLPLVHIDDVVQAILLALDRPTKPCREYNIVGPETPTQQELLALAAIELGVAPPKGSTPLMLAKAALSFRSLLSALHLARKPSISAHNLWQLSADRAYSPERAKAELGFEARVNIQNGIKQVVSVYRQKNPGESIGKG